MFDMELPFHEVFYPLGFSVEIITNDPDVLLACGESFGHVCTLRRSTALAVRIGVFGNAATECPPEPTRREFNHLYSLVGDAENQALLDLKTLTSFAWLSRAAIENRLYFRHNFLEKMVYLLLGARYVTDIHAACVSRNGKGILLCGDSGAGKSTLAYACARSGWTYTSDDTSYLISDSEVPRVIGHCHRARFRPSARALFPELQGRALSPRMEGQPSLEIPITQLPVQSTSPESTVDAVVYLSRNPDGECRLIPLPAGTATQRIRRELYSAGEIRARHERLLELLWDVPTYDLHYSDLSDGIKAIEVLTLQA
jgi:energy-coupling factor transporter ATP-binding protein EcfA2